MKAQLTYFPDSDSRYCQYKFHFDKACKLLSPGGILRTIWVDKTRVTGLSRREKGKFGVGVTFIVEVIAMKRMKDMTINRVEVKILRKKKSVKRKVTGQLTPIRGLYTTNWPAPQPYAPRFIIQDDPDASGT